MVECRAIVLELHVPRAYLRTEAAIMTATQIRIPGKNISVLKVLYDTRMIASHRFNVGKAGSLGRLGTKLPLPPACWLMTRLYSLFARNHVTFKSKLLEMFCFSSISFQERLESTE